jgi:hypothetical protein
MPYLLPSTAKAGKEILVTLIDLPGRFTHPPRCEKSGVGLLDHRDPLFVDDQQVTIVAGDGKIV